MFSNMLDKLTESIVKSVCICVVQRKAFGGGGGGCLAQMLSINDGIEE